MTCVRGVGERHWGNALGNRQGCHMVAACGTSHPAHAAPIDTSPVDVRCRRCVHRNTQSRHTVLRWRHAYLWRAVGPGLDVFAEVLVVPAAAQGRVGQKATCGDGSARVST